MVFFLEMIGAEPLESLINISAEEALGCVGGQTEDIFRKAFLLSSGEVGREDSYVIPASGKTLAYFGEMKTFDDLMKRVAYRGNMNGEKQSWYLRSVSTWDYNIAVGVSPDGVVGEIPVDREFGVRPAFCLDSNTPVLLREDGGVPVFYIENTSTTNRVISELAYDVNPELGYTVYIEEAGKPEPYLVVTANYNDGGDTLLLRKFLIEKPRRYNPPTTSSYYNGSEIDLWLNGAFLDRIGAEPVESLIDINAEEALDCNGEQTEDILRKIFLLSREEVWQGDAYMIPARGRTLTYFDDIKKRMASLENTDGTDGKMESWYLRSVNTWYSDVAVCVSPEGDVVNTNVTEEAGIRPAFCLDSNTPVLIRGDGEEPFFFIEKPIPDSQASETFPDFECF